jgi:ribosomal protein S1
MIRSTSMISPYETEYNDKIDLYIKSPRHLMRGNIITITKSKIFLDFGTKQLVALSRKKYIRMLTQIYILMNTSYVSTTRPNSLSPKLKDSLKKWLIKKVKLNESIDVKLLSIDSVKNITSIDTKATLNYLKLTKLFNEIEQIKKTNNKIKGFVLNRVKGGFSVAIGGIITFLPTKEILKIPNKKLSIKFINTSIFFKISKITFDKNNIILKNTYG